MSLGDRLVERLAATGMSQAELARRVGVTQPSINNLIKRGAGGSSRIHKIARALDTTPEYLLGEIDDPAADARLPAPPAPQLVMMHVAFPSEAALARMFQGLLLPLDLTRPKDEIAQLLARRLPTGFAQLRDLAPEHAPAAPRARDEAVPDPARDHRELPPASRT
ncbi:helix-turn-helix domain-containing protein [Sphingomonas sp. NFR15]|uniref:helix-turn-helix domain-containing protein n=1 Tax=Sphingomonas sp. NFR15 TaxID=1566282 RepID=UPI000B8999FE|nr:helix-turn-helix transcriptional regulator [Sphingomonas sp. NFR15]